MAAERLPRGARNGAKSAVLYRGSRLSSKPSPVAHYGSRKPSAINGKKMRGPRGPPMAHRKCGEWAIEKPLIPPAKRRFDKLCYKFAPQKPKGHKGERVMTADAVMAGTAGTPGC